MVHRRWTERAEELQPQLDPANQRLAIGGERTDRCLGGVQVIGIKGAKDAFMRLQNQGHNRALNSQKNKLGSRRFTCLCDGCQPGSPWCHHIFVPLAQNHIGHGLAHQRAELETVAGKP